MEIRSLINRFLVFLMWLGVPWLVQAIVERIPGGLINYRSQAVVMGEIWRIEQWSIQGIVDFIISLYFLVPVAVIGGLLAMVIISKSMIRKMFLVLGPSLAIMLVVWYELMRKALLADGIGESGRATVALSYLLIVIYLMWLAALWPVVWTYDDENRRFMAIIKKSILPGMIWLVGIGLSLSWWQG